MAEGLAAPAEADELGAVKRLGSGGVGPEEEEDGEEAGALGAAGALLSAAPCLRGGRAGAVSDGRQPPGAGVGAAGAAGAAGAEGEEVEGAEEAEEAGKLMAGGFLAAAEEEEAEGEPNSALT